MPVVVPPPFTHAPRRLTSSKRGEQRKGSLPAQPCMNRGKPSRYNGRGPQPATAPSMAVHRLAQGCHRGGRRQCSQHTHRSLNAGGTLDLSLSSPLHHHLHLTFSGLMIYFSQKEAAGTRPFRDFPFGIEIDTTITRYTWDVKGFFSPLCLLPYPTLPTQYR